MIESYLSLKKNIIPVVKIVVGALSTPSNQIIIEKRMENLI